MASNIEQVSRQIYHGLKPFETAECKGACADCDARALCHNAIDLKKEAEKQLEDLAKAKNPASQPTPAPEDEKSKRRAELGGKLVNVIGLLQKQFETAVAKADVEDMLAISDRIIAAASVAANLYGLTDIEDKIEWLEEITMEAEDA